MSSPTERASVSGTRAPAAPATIVVGLLIALCALLLLKWLAVVALGAVALAAAVRWGHRHAIRHRAAGAAGAGPEGVTAVHTADDCTWCGLTGGHRDLAGRLVRPRHAHVVR